VPDGYLMLILNMAVFCSYFLAKPPGKQTLKYLDTGDLPVALIKVLYHKLLFKFFAQTHMDSLHYSCQHHSIYGAQTLCIGALDGSPCDQAARKYGRSQALLKLVSCGGRTAERSYQILAKCILCERCQDQTDQARQWLDSQALPLLEKQTVCECHNNEEWVTARLNEIVRGRSLHAE
jgi:hypothetical protein